METTAIVCGILTAMGTFFNNSGNVGWSDIDPKHRIIYIARIEEMVAFRQDYLYSGDNRIVSRSLYKFGRWTG